MHVVEMEDDYECKSVTLPTGEIIYDPLDCEYTKH